MHYILARLLAGRNYNRDYRWCDKIELDSKYNVCQIKHQEILCDDLDGRKRCTTFGAKCLSGLYLFKYYKPIWLSEVVNDIFPKVVDHPFIWKRQSSWIAGTPIWELSLSWLLYNSSLPIFLYTWHSIPTKYF